ncbi:MAG: hypothetical protein B6U89_03650 [Desulfurococcales archaeon ex4484_58]|nr:MAG: hypothetical protein B6U89_03650 [Desulfurococcales archaeon ex4484_58]
MPIIKFLTKPDNTFLNLSLYEGILSLIKYVASIDFNENQLIMGNDTYRLFFKLVSSSKEWNTRIAQFRVRFVGNDINHRIPARILRALGIDVGDEKITSYDVFLNYLIKNYERLVDVSDDELVFMLIGNTSIVGKYTKDLLPAPQLFKIERYTSYTSLDTHVTYNQYGLKMTRDLTLISLIGLLSSYTVSAGGRGDFSYYFLFYSPDEISMLLSSRDRDLIDNLYTLKNKLIRKFQQLIKTPLPEDILLLEVMIDLELIKSVRELELDQISFLLYRIVPEGQTYKIYNTSPITIYSEPYYMSVLEKHVKNPDKFLEVLIDALKPENAILRAIYSLSWTEKMLEADQALMATRYLYWFISSGDPNGLYGFIRELKNAYEKVKNEAPGRARFYSSIVSSLSKYF